MRGLSAIVAIDRNNVMGNGADIPWHLPLDFKHFKKMTLNKTIIMGRKTYESIGKPLPNRTTVVLSTSLKSVPEGVILVSSILELKLYLSINECIMEDVFVCGGAEIYKALLPYTSTFYITHVDTEVEGDIIFPDIHEDYFWSKSVISETGVDEDNKYKCDYTRYAKQEIIK
jgi:dihydrofolate reductase